LELEDEVEDGVCGTEEVEGDGEGAKSERKNPSSSESLIGRVSIDDNFNTVVL
jgi:hypothetical protein